MKLLRGITQMMDIRTACNVKNINDWVANRKKEWNEQIIRMDNRKLSQWDEEAAASRKWTVIEQATLLRSKMKKKKKIYRNATTTVHQTCELATRVTLGWAA